MRPLAVPPVKVGLPCCDAGQAVAELSATGVGGFWLIGYVLSTLFEVEPRNGRLELGFGVEKVAGLVDSAGGLYIATIPHDVECEKQHRGGWHVPALALYVCLHILSAVNGTGYE